MSVAAWPSLASALAAFGQPATLRRPDDDQAIATTIVWLPPMDDPQPYGTDFLKREPRRVMVIPRAAVTDAWGLTLPRGTTIVAAEPEGTALVTWRMDGLVHPMAADEFRVSVVQVEGDC